MISSLSSQNPACFPYTCYKYKYIHALLSSNEILSLLYHTITQSRHSVLLGKKGKEKRFFFAWTTSMSYISSNSLRIKDLALCCEYLRYIHTMVKRFFFSVWITFFFLYSSQDCNFEHNAKDFKVMMTASRPKL